MQSYPEIHVTKRKTISASKAMKRMRRFVRDNQRPDTVVSRPDGADAADGEEGVSTELICPVPDETLFQLQQIYEALESRPDSIVKKTSTAEEHRPPSVEKTPTKRKRAREVEEPATEVIVRHKDEPERKEKRKKRRKSTSN